MSNTVNAIGISKASEGSPQTGEVTTGKDIRGRDVIVVTPSTEDEPKLERLRKEILQEQERIEALQSQVNREYGLTYLLEKKKKEVEQSATDSNDNPNEHLTNEDLTSEIRTSANKGILEIIGETYRSKFSEETKIKLSPREDFESRSLLCSERVGNSSDEAFNDNEIKLLGKFQDSTGVEREKIALKLISFQEKPIAFAYFMVLLEHKESQKVILECMKHISTQQLPLLRDHLDELEDYPEAFKQWIEQVPIDYTILKSGIRQKTSEKTMLALIDAFQADLTPNSNKNKTGDLLNGESKNKAIARLLKKVARYHQSAQVFLRLLKMVDSIDVKDAKKIRDAMDSTTQKLYSQSKDLMPQFNAKCSKEKSSCTTM